MKGGSEKEAGGIYTVGTDIKIEKGKIKMNIGVMDKGTGVCVDPGGKWGHHECGGEGGPGPPAGGKISRWYPTVETGRRSWDARRQRRRARRDIKTLSCTEYVSLYVLTYCNFNDCNREQCFTCLSVSGVYIIW
jgi:hypothetical protein